MTERHRRPGPGAGTGRGDAPPPPAAGRRRRPALDGLPVDPDLGQTPNRRRDAARPPGGARSRWPRVDGTVVAAVAVGGFLGGLARYGVTAAWPAPPGAVPWDVFGVNTGGAFLLGLMLVLVADVLPPTRYVRAVLATGFCGAFTTFSSVVVGVDRLVAHGRAGPAAGYLAASLLGGLAAASFGVLTGRSIAASRRRSGRRA